MADILPEALMGVSSAISYTKLTAISSYSLLIFDYLLTLDKEVGMVWHSKFGIGKALFFTIRYFTISAMSFIVIGMFKPWSTEHFCTAWIKFHWFAGLSTAILAELTLQLRLYAMYGGTRKIVVFLVITSLASFCGIFVFVCRILVKEQGEYIFVTSDNLFMCIPINLPSYYRTVWTPLFVHELILMALAVNKGIQNIKDHGTEGSMSRFTIFLVCDSVFFFFVVFGAFFTIEIVWIIRGVTFIEIPIGLAIVFVSVISQRQLINVRELYYNQTSAQFIMRRTGQEGMERGPDGISLTTFWAV